MASHTCPCVFDRDSTLKPTHACSKNSSVFVSNDLMELIKDPNEERESDPLKIKKNLPQKTHTHIPLFAHLTTMDQLLNDVKNYILRHKLFDPKDPKKILLDGNQLESLLGRSRISLVEVRDILLEKFVFPVSLEKDNSSEVTHICSDKKCLLNKRKLDKNDSEFFPSKKIKCLDVCETGTSCYDTDLESMHSFQDYETEFVKDDSSTERDEDDFSVDGLIIAETYDVDVEYEIESENSLSDSDFTLESDSDLEDFVKTAVINFIANVESDIEYLADQSSDDEKSEKELSEEDKWQCVCGTLNDPVMRCCCSCWTMRSGWLPETSSENSKREKESDMFTRNKRCFDQERERKEGKRERKRKIWKKLNKDKDIPPSAPTSKEDYSKSSASTSCNNDSNTIITQSKVLEIDKKNKTDALCLLCCSRPANCSIIHAKVGCRICCFVCGQKLLNNKDRCPTCRRNIEKIVYLYNL